MSLLYNNLSWIFIQKKLKKVRFIYIKLSHHII